MGIVQWLVIFFFLGILIIPMIVQYRQERKEKSKMEDDESLTFNINFTQVDNNAYKGMKTRNCSKPSCMAWAVNIWWIKKELLLRSIREGLFAFKPMMTVRGWLFGIPLD